MPVVLGDAASLNLSLGSGDLPPVRIVVNGALLSAGSTYEVIGTVPTGYSWTVRGGTGAATGEQVILVDTLAPVNQVITYTASLDGSVVSSGTITRTYLGGDILAADVIATLDSGTYAAFRREGGDSREIEPRAHESVVRGSEWRPLRLDPIAGAGGGELVAVTAQGHTAALRDMLRMNTLLVVYHDMSRCGTPGCDIGPVRVVFFTAAPSDRGPRPTLWERVWSLSYLDQSDPESGFVESLQDWDAFDAAGLTWDDVDALSLTWDQWDRVVWDESG